ncbi:MAG: hypothetical protein B9S32_03735 [Verrucomicrobia bacterium Tous-C9LFEB]|nr:MAG: hypothetical protein B9S32_03735 [Verrucomicrobia bacterium Tous-C9LFEB]
MKLKLQSPNTSSSTKTQNVIDDFQPRINPEIDARLTTFIEANPRSVEYYRQLITENPERAVRVIMLSRMLRHEDQMRLVAKQLPIARKWAEETPGMIQRIEERIKEVAPGLRDRAFVREAMRQKARMDFRPVAAAR